MDITKLGRANDLNSQIEDLERSKTEMQLKVEDVLIRRMRAPVAINYIFSDSETNELKDIIQNWFDAKIIPLRNEFKNL